MLLSSCYILVLCSMIVIHGASCHSTSRQHDKLKGKQMAEKKVYKRQTDCIEDELNSAGVDVACKSLNPTEVVNDATTLSQSSIYFSVSSASQNVA